MAAGDARAPHRVGGDATGQGPGGSGDGGASTGVRFMNCARLCAPIAPHHINGLADARAVAEISPTLPTVIIRVPCEQSANARRLLDFVEDRLDHGVHHLIRAEDIPRPPAIAQGNRTNADAPVLFVITQRVPDLPAASTVLVQVDDARDGRLPFDFSSRTVAPDGHIQAELLMPPGSLPLPPPVVVTVSRCEPLNDARELYQYKLTTLASDIGDDLLLGGAITDDVPLFSGDFKAALARVLKLPEDLAALKQHVEEQWLPWANDRLSSPGVIGDQILQDME
uniref:Uncharacterized protein n=1 Tax=Oryza punctata TaxID=4537 RepID=A0A0E0MFZ6_ORYPU